MHTKLLILFVIACSVSSHDISIGTDTEGRKIFDEVRQANPAIWRQIENVTIIAPDNEVISRVVVTDMRPEKDGDVEIVAGGEGKDNVTIELKSPTVLRGYEFHLEVYTVPETKLTDAEEGVSDTLATDKTSSTQENSETTTHKIEGSGNENKESDEKTTEIPEGTTVQIPALVGKTIVDGDILRQSRQLQNETNYAELSPSDLEDSSEKSDFATENVEKDLSTTTEGDTSTKIDEQVTFAPETFDNNKNTPDYPALSILDLIKSKEGTRNVRRTEDEINKSDDASTTDSMNTESASTTSPTTLAHSDDTIDLVPPVETEYNTGFSDDNDTETSSDPDNKPRPGRDLDLSDIPVELTKIIQSETDASTTESIHDTEIASTTAPVNSAHDDDTIDLVPPIETEYNTGFSDDNVETTEPNNKPRSGRGLDLSEIPVELTPSPEESATTEEITPSPEESTTTEIIDEKSENSTTESSFEQQRNTRGAKDDNNLNDLESNDPQNQAPLCPAVQNDKTPSNVIILNGEQLTLTPDPKLQFGIPIVLVIASDTNIPTIKIIAEDSSESVNKDIQIPEGSMDQEDDFKLNDYQERDISEDDFVPRPVMNFN